MKKIRMIFVGIALVIMMSIALFLPLHSEASVISNKDNTITMTSNRIGNSSGATGYISVRDGEHLHLEYTLSDGIFDIAICEKDYFRSKYPNGFEDKTMMDVLSSLDTFGQNNISGNGTLNFETDAGDYVVFFILHSTIGEAVVSSKSK